MTDIRLLRGDCLHWLPELPAKSIDVVCTSPPFNIQTKYNSYADDRSDATYLTWLFQVGQHLHRVMQPDGSWFLNISGSLIKPLLPFRLINLLATGKLFYLQNTIIWVKSITVDQTTRGHFKPINGRRFLNHTHEFIFHLTKTGKVELDRLAIGVPYQDQSNIRRRQHRQNLRCRGNTWFIPYPTVQRHSQKFNHPASFPTTLAQNCIRLHGVKHATVLDPFVGIGSTMAAAIAEKCQAAIGIDLDPQYIAAAAERLREI